LLIEKVSDITIANPIFDIEFFILYEILSKENVLLNVNFLEIF